MITKDENVVNEISSPLAKISIIRKKIDIDIWDGHGRCATFKVAPLKELNIWGRSESEEIYDLFDGIMPEEMSNAIIEAGIEARQFCFV